MEVIHKILEFLGLVGRQTADKAKEIKEIAGLKSQIAACEEVAQKNYAEIGRLYYAKYGEEADAEFAKQCRAIQNAEYGAGALKEKLKEVKNSAK